MDKQVIALFIPILAMAIPVVAIVFAGMQKIAKLRLEEARLRAGPPGAASPAEIETLRAEVAEIRQGLLDVEERLDFAERALVQSREAGRLPGGLGGPTAPPGSGGGTVN